MDTDPSMNVHVHQRPTFRFILTLTGCFFLLMPSSLTWYWGNMSIYVYSYIHYHRNTNSHDVKAPWLLSIYIIMWSIGMIVTGYLTRCFNRKCLVVLGMLSFNGGILLSYFVLGDSLTVLDFTLGLFSGLGNGLLFSLVMQIVVEWTEKRVGFTTSIVIMGSSVGAIVINQFTTHFVNPRNLKVDTVIGRTKFFSQKEVLERVPSMFLLVSAFNICCHFIGFCLTAQKLAVDGNSEDKDDDGGGKENAVNEDDTIRAVVDYTTPLLNHEKTNEKPKFIYMFKQQADGQGAAKPTDVDPSIQNYERQINLPNENLSSDNQSSKSPSEVLSSRSFYILWFMLFTTDIGYIIVCNYYKAFGQTHIKNDHFLTNLGTSLSVVNIVMRMVWGTSLDYIQMKTSLIAFVSSLSIINSLYFFTPIVSKWLFFCWSLANGGLASGVYINFAIVVTRLYGKKHFHTNFGLIFTATIAVNLIAPPIFRVMLRRWGWFVIFMTPAGFGLVSLVLIIAFLSPEKERGLQV